MALDFLRDEESDAMHAALKAFAKKIPLK